MITVSIPGFKDLKLKHLALDFNGTLAIDGVLIDGVAAMLEKLSRQLDIHIITADTFGTAAKQLEGLPCKLVILPVKGQDLAKQAYIQSLGSDETVCIGNGRNDQLMVIEATVGIAVIQEEGATVEAILNADIVCKDILQALALLDDPRRLVATMRA